MSADQIRERELREIAKCAICGQPFGESGLPLFWRLRLTRYGVDTEAVRRQDGLGALLGSSGLAMVMGTDEPMATAIDGPTEITVCESCAGKQASVYELNEYAHPEGR